MAVTARSETLTSLNITMPKLYTCLLLAFKTSQAPSTIMPFLQNALAATAKQIPWISGRVKPFGQNTGSASGIVWSPDAETPTLTDTGTINVAFKDWVDGGMNPAAFPVDRWPLFGGINDVGDDAFPEGAPVFGWGIFRFSDHRGVGLCISIHHHVADAHGTGKILEMIAGHVRGVGRDLTVADRSSHLHSALSLDLADAADLTLEDLFASHPEYSTAPMVFPTEYPECMSKVVTFSIDKIKALRERLQRLTKQVPSTNTVLSAVIWSAITQARLQRDTGLSAKGTTRLGTMVNGRKRINPSFSTPDHPYFGNMVLFARSEIPFAAMDDLKGQHDEVLARICDTIAESISPEKINRQHIAEVFSILQKLDKSKPLTMGWDAFGSRDVSITSWADLDFYELDFGADLGKPVAVRLPHYAIAADGVCVLLPRKRRGSAEGDDFAEIVEVVLMLRTDDMDAFARYVAMSGL